MRHLVSTHGRRVRRPFLVLVLAALLSCGLGPRAASAEESAGDPESGGVLAAPTSPSSLAWKGGATLLGVRPSGSLDLSIHLEVSNPTDRVLGVSDANLFAVGAGGWLTPIEMNVLRGRLEIGPRNDKFVGNPLLYDVTDGPASHVLLSATADDGPSEFSMPLFGGEAYHPKRPLGVGVALPLEVYPFADGRNSLVLLGQVQSLSGLVPYDVKVEAFLADSTGAFEPSTLTGLGGHEDQKRMWPFVRRMDVPDGFRGGFLKVFVTATLDGQAVEDKGREWPVEVGRTVAVRGPVLGMWHLVNGPGQTGLHANYRNPNWRYSYDFIVVEQGTTYRGPPHQKESYFAWNRSVRAVAAGKVIDACDREADNAGLGLTPAARSSPCQGVNRVVLEHPDGVRTVYLHLRQNSLPQGVRPGTSVEEGAIIGTVGNSGQSMEPHLHLVAYRLEANGHPRPVALTFSNAFHDPGRQRPVKGVPVGGRTLHFID